MHQPLVVDATTLFVFSRFETVDLADTPVIGDRFSLLHLQSLSKSQTNPDEPWTQGVLQPETSTSIASTVFELNGQASSKWYYHWESGANKARRLTKHVLKAYVLYRRPQGGSRDDIVQVIGIVSSPQFTLVSYRRSWEVADPIVDGTGQHVTPQADGRTHAFDLHHIVRGQISEAFRNYQNNVHDGEGKDDDDSRDGRLPRLRGGESSEDGEDVAEVLPLWVWERHHAAALRPIKDLAVIYWFLSHTSMASALRSTRVREHMYAALQSHGPLQGTASGQPLKSRDLLSVLFPPHSDSSGSSTTPISSQVEKLLIIVAKLAIWMISGDSIRVLQAFFDSCASHLLRKKQLRHSYLEFIDILCQRVQVFWSEVVVASATTGSQTQVLSMNALRMLSEHILALSQVDINYQYLWPDLRKILESPESLLWTSFIAQVRETFVRQQARVELRGAGASPSGLSGSWRLDSVTTDDTLNDASISVTLMGIVQLQRLSIRVVGAQTLQIHGPNSLLPEANDWMALVCDELPRTANVLPLGLSTLVGFHVAGVDYVGKMNARRTHVQLEFYWWPRRSSTVANARATRVVLTLKRTPASMFIHVMMEIHHAEMAAAELDELAVVELESARNRLGIRVEWSHAWRATATYVEAEA